MSLDRESKLPIVNHQNNPNTFVLRRRRLLRLPTNGKVIIKSYLPDSGTRNALDLANGGQKPGTPIKLLAYTGNFNQQASPFL